MIDENLKQYATERQWEIYTAYCKYGSARKAGKELGMNQSAVSRGVSAIKKKAEAHGYIPEMGMVNPSPPGFPASGYSRWFKTDDGGYWLKTKYSDEDKEQIDAIVESLKIPKFKPVKQPKALSDEMMNVYVFGDPHIDMLAWAPETGNDWDLDIAEQHHISAMTDMVNRSPKCDTAVLATLGDLFHRDSLKALTPGSGNLVDVDGRLSRSWDRGVRMIRAMIDQMLKKYQTVKYVCVRGNHSPTLELILAKTIRIAYQDEPRVEVLENTPKEIPVNFGCNFLLFVHGDGLNDQKKAEMVTSRFRKFHGEAKFSHALTGHTHHAYQKEMSGVLVEIFSVLPTPDAWHCENGYVTSDQAASVLTYHKAGGIIQRTVTNPRIYLGL